ncbi:MAG: hypothetical protein DCO95_03420 [Roseivirga sp. XM-24bin3]|nr:MAG: hypothetical protein DCO95_03420 [Roseivirga sp. XM-24bin3]
MGMELKIAIGRILIILFSIGVLVFSCEEQRPEIIGCWANVYEEGQDVYKPCNMQAFAPGHFRQVYDFRSDGTVNYLVLHPADAHFMREAKWVYKMADSQVDIIDSTTDELLLKLSISIHSDDAISITEMP